MNQPSASPVTLQVDGIDVHIEGEGPEALVMVHGWPDTWRLWDAQVAFFKGRYRCVRFTLPGFDVDQPRRPCSLDETLLFLGKVVDAASPGRPVVLMLHDWGCVFGYQFCMRHPERVSRVIGIDIGDAGSPKHVRSLGLAAKLGVLLYQGWLALAWRIGGRLGDKMSRGCAKAMKVPAEPRYIGSSMNYPYDIAVTGSHGSYKRAVPVEPACPLLFAYGLRKPFMFHSPEWAEAQRRKPGNQVIHFDAGHWVMRDQREAFNQAVSAWLAGGV